MMRCLQCGQDFPDGQEFCHQCGEPLQPREVSPDRAAARGRSDLPARRARALSRRRAPARSQSFLFAVLVLLGAGAGLALVWRQAWMPLLPRVTVSVSRPQDRRPADTVLPTNADTSAAAKVEPATPATTTAV